MHTRTHTYADESGYLALMNVGDGEIVSKEVGRRREEGERFREGRGREA